MNIIKQIWIISLSAIIASCVSKNNPEQVEKNKGTTFYIGGYTAESKPDIYRAELMENGEVSNLIPLAFSGNPSYLAVNNDQSLLYTANEYFDKDGVISVYKLENDTLLLSDQISSGGLYPCYIALVDESTGFVANYGGSISKFTANGKGKLTDPAITIQHSGSSIVPERQTGPHPHTVAIHPNKKWGLVTDLGTDEIVVYDLADWREINRFKTEPGAGPRHIAFRNEQQAYVTNELNSTIAVLSISPDGKLEQTQIISTLPTGFEGVNYPADIHIHPSGKFLYASNRGHDSIVLFNIENDGSLKFVETYRGQISWPRNFAISPDGNFLLIANQKGNSINILKIVEGSGKLSDIHSNLNIPTPTHILFPNH